MEGSGIALYPGPNPMILDDDELRDRNRADTGARFDSRASSLKFISCAGTRFGSGFGLDVVLDRPSRQETARAQNCPTGAGPCQAWALIRHREIEPGLSVLFRDRTQALTTQVVLGVVGPLAPGALGPAGAAIRSAPILGPGAHFLRPHKARGPTRRSGRDRTQAEAIRDRARGFGLE